MACSRRGKGSGNEFVEGVKRWDGDRKKEKMRLHQTTTGRNKINQLKQAIEQQILSNHPITSIPFQFSHAQSPKFVLIFPSFCLHRSTPPPYPLLSFLRLFGLGSQIRETSSEKKSTVPNTPNAPFVTPFGICILAV
jgi:hypothetical protein